MLDLVLQALQTLFTPDHFIYLILGVLLGLIIGVFPGLGGIAGLSLLLPFLYGMDQISALATLIGLVAVIPTSATFTSVLMGIPGSSSSQATVLDGFALAKKGQASRALGAAFSASLFGGLFGALILTFFVQIARPVILIFGSAELFMLAVFGLSMVGSLSGKSLVKGVIACGFGLIVGSMGAAPATGEFRMTFGVDYLYDGLPLVVIALSVFAFPEISELFRKDASIAEKGAGLGKGGWMTGVRDLIKNKWLALRCAGIGTIVGAIPGMGGSVVDWIAYGHVVQTSKDKSQFGKGDIRGVIAPESANNAKEGGALMPTLLFGIPGSGSMAVFLGGMVLIGIEAGPSMVTTDIELTYSIIWSLAIANVIGAGLSLFLAGPISKLTRIRFSLLAPFMIMVISFAAFQATKDMMDLWALLGFGVIGIFMKRFGWSRPAFLIGFVLSTQAESYLNMAVQFYGWDMFLRPGVLIIMVLSLLTIYFSRRGTVDENAELMEKERNMDLSMWPQFIFALFLVAFIVLAIFSGARQSFLGGVFPLTIALIILPFGLWLLWIFFRKKQDNPAVFDAEQVAEEGTFKAPWYEPLLWVGGLYGLSVIIGFIPAIVLFFICFFTLKAKTGFLKTALLTAGGVAVLLAFGYFLNLEFPQGVF
jgi:putative tricarboxylic transport membrane protein